jgi:nicotinate-nucleotide adenylyltransferase
MSTRRIGIYGGTFNPIHNAHLLVAQTALESLNLDQVIFIPAGIPPLKGTHQLVSGEQRLAMVQLAIADNPNFLLDDFEVRRGDQKSFTIDTVRFLRSRHSDAVELFLILGDDCVSKLHHWKGIDELQRLVHFVCVNRLHIAAPANTPPLTKITMPTLPISSTQLRERIAAGQSVCNLTPAVVADYIERHGLYHAVHPLPAEAAHHV